MQNWANGFAYLIERKYISKKELSFETKEKIVKINQEGNSQGNKTKDVGFSQWPVSKFRVHIK